MVENGANQNDRRWSFDRDAGVYEGGRPPYPGRVYTFMEEIGALAPGTKVLEIGPGTGQATAELLDRGATVDAIELGANLAGMLRERISDPRLNVTTGDIHTIDLPDAVYDTVVAATMFHWLDVPALLPRLAAALRPGGWLVVWWTVYGDPDASTPFRREVDRIYRERMPHEWRPLDEVPRAMRIDERIAELTQGGCFTDPRHELIRWSARLTSGQVRALFATFPNVAELDPATREAHLGALAAAVEAEGGVIDDPYATAVYAVRKSA
jgi:SAM-dependent methyltransferase